MDQSEMPPCEECGTRERRRTRNRLPDGARKVLCHGCVRQLRERLRKRDRRQLATTGDDR